MSDTIFLAGATGAIGSRLVPMLVARGYRVIGLTRRAESANTLLAQGALPVVGDVFDAPGLTAALRAARPEIVIHQLTDLPRALDPSRMEEGVRRNARIRREGTANLVAAALAAGARRMVAQSIAWAYADGPLPHGEEAPLDVQAEGLRSISVGGVVALESAVLAAAGMDGLVLRFGQLHGPGTGSDDAAGKSVPLHVDAAAWATVLASERGRPGVYNIVGQNPQVTADKARREFGWDGSNGAPA